MSEIQANEKTAAAAAAALRAPGLDARLRSRVESEGLSRARWATRTPVEQRRIAGQMVREEVSAHPFTESLNLEGVDWNQLGQQWLVYAQERIVADDVDWWKCVCGNEPDGYGFVTCLATGESIEPYGNGPWDGQHMRCQQCGRVARQDERDPEDGVPVRFIYPLEPWPRCDRVVARAGGLGACDRALPAEQEECGSPEHVNRRGNGGPRFNG